MRRKHYYRSTARIYQYPINLICDIFENNRKEDILKMEGFDLSFPKDINETMDYLIDITKNKTHPEILDYRYKNRMSYNEIAKVCCISPERVKQIIVSSLIKMRCNYKNIIIEGISQYKADLEEMKKQHFRLSIPDNKIEVIRDKETRDIKLSPRSFNCLTRFGISTVADIISIFENYSILNVRALEKRNIKEIADVIMLKDFNIDTYIEYKENNIPAIEYLKNLI